MGWFEEGATGVDAIDKQHQWIFSMCDDYRVTLEMGYGNRTYPTVLRTLRQYVLALFEVEEELLPRRCALARDTRRVEDLMVFGEFARFETQLAEHGFSEHDAREFLVSLESWLAAHLTRLDYEGHDRRTGPVS